jgi:hypothetical protein
MSGDAHPLAEQCPAKSKRTGERCQLRVIGGGPCRWHGGNAPQVRAAREARIVAAEAAREAPRSAADAADVLTSAMNDAHALKERLKENLAAGRITEMQAFSALGEWVDRSARISKLVVDAGIEERQVRLAESAVDQVVQVVNMILDDLGLDARQRDLVPVVVPRAFRSIPPPRELTRGGE